MDPRAVDRLLRVFAAIAAPAVLGCGPGPGDGIDPSTFSEDICTDAGLRMLEAIEVDDPADYLELRSASQWGLPGEENEFSDPYVRDSAGEKCGGASDSQACLDAFAALPLESELVRSGFEAPEHSSIAFTRADEVGAIVTLAGVRELLGSIDAPADAALLATMDGHSLVCGPGDDVGEVPDGYVLHTRSGGGCGESDDVFEHLVHVSSDGQIEILESELVQKGDPGCAVGRLPAGLCRSRPTLVSQRRARPLGDFFAEVAHLEAAAVPAFGQLARELAIHGAPRSMIRAALRSRRDEIRHARVTAAIARRFGGRPVAPRVAAFSPRSLADMAADNAAEGCIRETYGALVAHVQAHEARDPALRRALRRIARDETRHAALSWELSHWARARMSVSQRRRVATATKSALDRLQVELTRPMAEDVHAIAGMPRPDRAHALFGGLRRALFDDAA